MNHLSQQISKKSSYQWIGSFFVYSAGPILIAYLLLLLSMSYLSQQNLKQASKNTLLFNIEKRASALSYFHSERLNDISVLANDRALSVYFSNRDLGMSMEYGLRASLLVMKNQFKSLVKNKQINSKPIYLRLIFIEEQDKSHLVDEGLANNIDEPWLNNNLMATADIKTIIFEDIDHSHFVILYPYHYKGRRIGTILAEINYDEVNHHLIHTEYPEPVQYVILADKLSKVLSHKQSVKQLINSGKHFFNIIPVESDSAFTSYIKKPIKGTPLILAARYDKHYSESFLTSHWYILSLIILAIMVVSSVLVGIHTRTKNLLLQSNVDESKKQRDLLNEKNELLKKEVRQRLNSETQLQTLIESIPDLIWLKDPKGIYLICNLKFSRFFGAKQEDIIGKTDYDFVDKKTADSFRKYDKLAISTDQPSINEESIIFSDDGHEELVETIKTPLKDSEGKLAGVLGVARDITARKRAEEKFLYLSVHDPLTGLYNRRVFEQRINEEMERAKRYQRELSIFMLDIDYFKQINDTYGHQNGDITLCHIAELLNQSIRKSDYVARYGGEEFIIVLPDTSLTKSHELAERLCHKIAKKTITLKDGKEISITATLGVAAFPLHGQSWHELVHASDNAMYAAKEAGRNQVKIAS